MSRTVHAEWTKLRTVQSTAWLALAAVGLTVALGAALAASLDVSQCPPTGCAVDTTRLSLTGVRLGQVAVVVLAVLAMSNEYGTRMIQTTLLADPRRVVVLAGKCAVVTATALLVGGVGAFGSLVAARGILPGTGFTAANGYPPPSLADEPTLRAAIGTALYLGLVALLSIGVAAIVRDTAGAVTAVISLLYAAPMIGMFVTDPVWEQRLQRFSPMTAGLAVQATTDAAHLPVGPWAGLGTLAGYAAGAIAVGAVLFRLRDT